MGYLARLGDNKISDHVYHGLRHISYCASSGRAAGLMDRALRETEMRPRDEIDMSRN